MRILVLVVGSLLAVVSFGAHAGKLYKWVDNRGNVSYQDSPPPPGMGRVEEKNLREQRGANPGTVRGDRPSVVLYVAAKCAVCDIARNYLSKRKIPFAERNISADPKAQEELKARIGSSVLPVPVITIGTKLSTEYSQAWLDSELAAAGYGNASGQQAEGQAENQAEGGQPAEGRQQ